MQNDTSDLLRTSDGAGADSDGVQHETKQFLFFGTEQLFGVHEREMEQVGGLMMVGTAIFPASDERPLLCSDGMMIPKL